MSSSSKKRERRLTAPVTAVITAICYIYFTTIFIFLDRWFGIWSSPGIINAIVFTLLAALSVFNYFVALFTDPGRVPPAFVPDIEDGDTPIQEIKRKGFAGSIDVKGGDLRYCQKCSHYKPPRAHHCRVCKRCVLRMDHHCIWMNNCVGHANYRVFFSFVLYAVIAIIYSAVLLLGSIFGDTGKEELQNNGSLRIIYMVSCLLIFPLTVALSVLLGWHIYLILRNKTTIEYYEGVRAMWLAEKGGELYKHPYDLGPYNNLTSVLGPNIFGWICPMSGHSDSGLRFPTAYDKLTGSASD